MVASTVGSAMGFWGLPPLPPQTFRTVEGGSNGAAPAGLTCQRHGRPTRITCVTCDTPICPACAIRTQVGLKCPDHASKPVAPRKGRFQLVGGLLVLLA